MAEGPMADVVEKRRDAEKLFHIVGRRAVRYCRLEGGIEMTREPSGQVHGAEHMLEPAVLGRRIDPARALKLVDLPEPLHPRGVQEVLLGLFPRPARRS